MQKDQQQKNQDALSGATIKKNMKQYPELGEVFSLTINGQDLEVQSLAMLKRYAEAMKKIYDDTLRHKGNVVAGIQTRNFKLISVGHYLSWMEMRNLAEVEGGIPESQWLEVFRITYPNHDGEGNVGVPDNSWLDDAGKNHFPYIGSNGRLAFSMAIGGYNAGWRLLVAARNFVSGGRPQPIFLRHGY